MKETSKKRIGGIPVNRFAFPVLVVVAIFHIIIVILIINANRSNATLSDLMKKSGSYQLDALSLQGSNSVMSETCGSYIQRAGNMDASVIAAPLATYASELNSDGRASKVLERFRGYGVSSAVLQYIENAAELSDQMTETQLHAISLIRSVYPFPDTMPELSGIPMIELTPEERQMPDEARIGLAKSLILNESYAMKRYYISQSISGCNRTLQEEFDQASYKAERHVSLVRALLWISVIIIILILSATFIMFYRLIVKPVRNYSESLDENKGLRQIKAITELRRLAEAHNNLMDRRNKLESILREEAETDALTGLPNRFSMESDLIENEAYTGALCVLLFDVNFLKYTNDKMGHPAGDRLLCAAADCIKTCFSDEKGENCYRIGGDEFVAILKDCREEDVQKMLARFDEALKEKHISVSVGYAFEQNADGGSFARMMETADKRMYEQKKLIHESAEKDPAFRDRPFDQTQSGAESEEAAAKAKRADGLIDGLTGLPSITYFFELAEAGRRAIQERGGSPALLYTDFSGMKYYNHKYGFARGDLLINSFAGLLSRTFDSEKCCHIGADHFAVLADQNGIEEKLGALFREWNEMNGSNPLPVCVGIFPDWSDAIPVTIAYDRSKIACDAIKGTYNSCFHYFNSEMNEAYVKQRYILENFEKALSEKWIRVYYQPIMRAINLRVSDEEALARWIDPEKGLLSPAEFVPVLEEAGLIYKLDLYVLEQVLENMQTKTSEGLYLVPHSINISRSDFDACDIVEEIRRRVDRAGVSRGKICIEITESVIGSDFDFMKAQIERFQKLGFPVWMDDFGSGYSSLHVLHSVKFDLIKFDMNFMRKLDESRDGRIIMTKLTEMTSALGVDTICEGVETEDQARFLQEIGCSKLQGYYYSKPVPFEKSMEWHLMHKRDGYEDPEESSYFESICGINLFDVSVIASDAEGSLRNAYSTLPMGVIEIKGDSTRFLRSNQSYRDFFKRFFGLDISTLGPEFVKYDAAFMFNVVKTCCEQGVRSFYDEKMPDGSVVHSFARRIGRNAVTGNDAVAVAVLSISDPREGTTYVEIARALAADYYCMYVVDLETEQYIEYSSPIGGQTMAVERHGVDFFKASLREASRVYSEDREAFFGIFNKEQIEKSLDEQGVFTATYRLVDTGKPVWVNMKITRMQPSSRIIIGVSIIDAQMRQKEQHEELQKERAAMVRVMALSDGYLSLYTVDPENGHYIEFTSSDDYKTIGAPKEGDCFFDQLIENATRYLYKEDQTFFLERFSEEKVKDAIREQGYYTVQYRIMINGEPRPALLRIAPFTEGEKNKLLVSVKTQ